jgi:hypothetical protein
MVLFDGRTDSPSASGWQLSPRQTLQTEDENDTTVIRDAIDTQPEAKAKLRKIKYADGVGDAPYFVPEPSRNRYRATSINQIGRTGSSSVFGQKRCAPRAEASLSLARTTRSCSRIQSRGDFKDNGVLRVIIPLCERGESASQTRQTGIGRPLATPATNEP